jgi:hypothetical protein
MEALSRHVLSLRTDWLPDEMSFRSLCPHRSAQSVG